MSVVIEQMSIRADASARLLARFEEEMIARSGGGIDPPPERTPDGLEPPTGTFAVMLLDGEPIGCGGVRELEDEVGELKRMYVVPEARGRGHGRQLLAALEEAARELGYRRVRLDTGPVNREAKQLYRSAGYRPIRPYTAMPAGALGREGARLIRRGQGPATLRRPSNVMIGAAYGAASLAPRRAAA